MSHHIQGYNCPLCQEKVSISHPKLKSWWKWVKNEFPDIHVSCSYRTEKDQEDAFSLGKTHLHYPKSQHNKTPAEALDIFQLLPNDVAVFDKAYMALIYKKSIDNGYIIAWGGLFKSLGDSDHFGMTPDT